MPAIISAGRQSPADALAGVSAFTFGVSRDTMVQKGVIFLSMPNELGDTLETILKLIKGRHLKPTV